MTLKPCPFHDSRTCGCLADLNITDKTWSTRPIEDALRAQLAEAEKALKYYADDYNYDTQGPFEGTNIARAYLDKYHTAP